MLIDVRNFDRLIYLKLINYMLKKCNVFSVKKYCGKHSSFYNKVCEEWLKKYSSNIINQQENFLDINDNIGDKLHSITYFIKIDENIKKELFNKNSLFDWNFPNSIEDICLFKDDICFLESVAHESLCFINFENNDEYNLLKSMGIVFYDTDGLVDDLG